MEVYVYCSVHTTKHGAQVVPFGLMFCARCALFVGITATTTTKTIFLLFEKAVHLRVRASDLCSKCVGTAANRKCTTFLSAGKS